jgi:hypothetical protein
VLAGDAAAVARLLPLTLTLTRAQDEAARKAEEAEERLQLHAAWHLAVNLGAEKVEVPLRAAVAREPALPAASRWRARRAWEGLTEAERGAAWAEAAAEMGIDAPKLRVGHVW